MASRELKLPDVHKLDPDQVVVRYDKPSDTLFVHFYGSGQPGVSVQVNDYAFVRLDLKEETVIGVQIEAFLKEATVKRPSLLALAQFADVPPELMREWRERDSANLARIEYLDSIIHEWTDPITA